MSAPTQTGRRRRTTTYSPALPAEADISKKHVGWPGAKRVAKLLGYVQMRIPVWWRRPSFHDAQFRDTAPKWHVLRARIHSGQDKDWDILWVAQCGYEHVSAEILDWPLDFRKTPPKKAERCKKCDEALVELKRAAAQKEGANA